MHNNLKILHTKIFSPGVIPHSMIYIYLKIVFLSRNGAYIFKTGCLVDKLYINRLYLDKINFFYNLEFLFFLSV